MFRLLCTFAEGPGTLALIGLLTGFAVCWTLAATLVGRETWKKAKDAGGRMRVAVHVPVFGSLLSLCAIQFYRENYDIFQLVPGSVPLSMSPMTFVRQMALLAVLVLGLLHCLALVLRFSPFTVRATKAWNILHFFVMAVVPLLIPYEIHARYGVDLVTELQKSYTSSFGYPNIIFALAGLVFTLLLLFKQPHMERAV